MEWILCVLNYNALSYVRCSPLESYAVFLTHCYFPQSLNCCLRQPTHLQVTCKLPVQHSSFSLIIFTFTQLDVATPQKLYNTWTGWNLNSYIMRTWFGVKWNMIFLQQQRQTHIVLIKVTAQISIMTTNCIPPYPSATICIYQLLPR